MAIVTINVANEAQLRAAIFQVSNDFATDGVVADDYVINLTANFTLTQSLPMIRGDGVHTITLIQNTQANFVGGAKVDGGLLRVDGSIASANVAVNTGGTLGGNGATGAVTVASGGTIAAGASAGILSTGSLALVAGASFEAEIEGTSAGVGGYDQVKVTSTVALGGASLDASALGGFDFVIGMTFKIIDNDGSDAVSGTFAGLAEGSVVDVGGYDLAITYMGGDGNDVVLFAGVYIAGTPEADVVDATHTVAGQPFPTAVGDEIIGLPGKDILSGLGGNDFIYGSEGGDTIHGDEGDDLLDGQNGRDTIVGGEGNDDMDGGKCADKLDGGAGNDTLNGGLGKDKLTGGTGDNTFVFADPNKPDKVTDFDDGDGIGLLKDAFPKIGPLGELKAKHFHVGAFAETKAQKIIYDDETGWLSYAKNGVKTADPVAFVRIGKGLDLDHSDFMVI